MNLFDGLYLCLTLILTKVCLCDMELITVTDKGHGPLEVTKVILEQGPLVFELWTLYALALLFKQCILCYFFLCFRKLY